MGIRALLVVTGSNRVQTEVDGSGPEPPHLLRHREVLKFGRCPFKRPKCPCKTDRGEKFMLMKVICAASSNQSEPAHEYPDCRDGAGVAGLLVSPLVVAGIVIGLVLFLSCVTIIVGSLRKDGRLPSHHLHAREGSDGLSYGGSAGELRSPCVEEFAPEFDFGSYAERPTGTGLAYPDSPPRYEECVGPGATEIYVPTEDPPPYSLTDPCPDGFRPATPTTSEAEEHWNGASYLAGTPVSFIGLPTEDAPPYEAVVSGPHRPIPLMPAELLKHPGEESELRGAISHRTA